MRRFSFLYIFSRLTIQYPNRPCTSMIYILPLECLKVYLSIISLLIQSYLSKNYSKVPRWRVQEKRYDWARDVRDSLRIFQSTKLPVEYKFPLSIATRLRALVFYISHLDLRSCCCGGNALSPHAELSAYVLICLVPQTQATHVYI